MEFMMIHLTILEIFLDCPLFLHTLTLRFPEECLCPSGLPKILALDAGCRE